MAVDSLLEVGKQYGITSFKEMPPADLARLRILAVQMVQDTPAFGLSSRKFFERDLGLITSTVD